MAAALKPDLAYGIKVGHINHEFMRHSVGDTLNVAVFAYLDINLDTHTHTNTAIGGPCRSGGGLETATI